MVVQCSLCKKVVIAPDDPTPESLHLYSMFDDACKCGAVNYCKVTNVITAKKDARRWCTVAEDWTPYKPHN
jgi:hypothetical protein